MKVGDMVRLCEEPWHQHSGDFVFVTKIDEDGKGFDFMIPETRGHAPMNFVVRTYGNHDVEKLRWNADGRKG